MEAGMEANKEPGDTSLLTFIERNQDAILEQWERFARSIPSARRLQSVVLRDHAAGMLREIVADLKVAQTPGQQAEKSQGRAPRGASDTQAELHGADRVAVGFTVSDAISEFRALRACVLQLWGEANIGALALASGELTRFNEAIDQAVADSVKRFALEKEEYTRRFDTLLSSSPDLQCIIGIDGRLIYANQALSNQFAISQEDLVGASLDVICPVLTPRIGSDLRKVIDTREPLRAEASLPGPDGAEITYRYVFLPVFNDSGQVDSITGTARNISELKASEEKIHRNAYYDSLTQLPNRALFHDRLEQNVKRAERTGNPLALLFIDLDDFKEVNDRSGHATGDQLLQESAHRIGACVRGSDTVARIGGDEFTVILSEVHDVLHIEILAQAILDELARPFEIGASNYFISGSVGITLYPQDGHTPDELLRNADQAMYVSKQAGRNRFSFFTAEMRDSAWARLKTIDELRQALVLNQLEVYYQPIIDLGTGAIAKAEALVRWHHPQGGLVLPDAFIGLAEQTGLIGEIGAWVLEKAVEQARQWSALLGRPFQISVNKSAVEFMNTTVMKSWGDLDVLALARDQIAVEITEGVLLNDSCAVRERLDMLKRAGVQFAIDDFGIGYSSMSYLKKFQVDFLKIDKSFVKGVMQSADNGIFAETITVMAHKLGLKVIAEGVETVEQRDWLKAMDCDYAQGFLFSEAAPSDRVTDMLKNGRC
jgi:diguanylate cyclase (GGDEF)-like protein/PAS domain S-box-containing protein